MKRIVLTGGGTAGHVTPNIAIINELDKKEWEIHYIGSKKGIEKELIEKIHIPYHSISSGKLRRYLSVENAKDVFKVLKGCLDARKILKKLKPAVVFSKGGFVSVPVVIAANMLKIPVIIHESDLTPGLANKIALRFASKIFTSFDETLNYLPKEKSMVIGSPIRKDILTGSAVKGRVFLDFTSTKPIITVMGGSLGARKINEVIRENLAELTKKYQIVHLCGKGNIAEEYTNNKNYKQLEYVHEELADILAATSLVITRGGSNAIFEFLALKLPMLIIPLSKQQSRGDQILNAKSFTKKGFSLTLEEEDITSQTFLANLAELDQKQETMKQAMQQYNKHDALTAILEEVKKH